MRHICNKKPISLPVESCCDINTTEIYHPLSYYLNGGIDLVGDALDKSAEVEYDNEEEVKELVTAGAMSVPYGDPRESKFTLVERYGVEAAKKAATKSASPTTMEPNDNSVE